MAKRLNLGDPIPIFVGTLIFLLGVILLLLSYLLGDIPSHILHDAGLVMVGTVAVAYILELGLRKHHAKEVCEIVASTVVPGAACHGLERIVTRMDFQGLFESLSKHDELLWLDTYCPEQAIFQRNMRHAIERGAKIRMLAVDPESNAAKARAHELYTHHGYTYEAFEHEAKSNIRHLGDAFSDMRIQDQSGIGRESLRLRLYKGLPCVPMYLVLHKGTPSRGYTSFFLRNPSFEEPHLEWGRADESMLDDFVSYFEYKWNMNGATERDLESLVEETEFTAAGAPRRDSG